MFIIHNSFESFFSFYDIGCAELNVLGNKPVKSLINAVPKVIEFVTVSYEYAEGYAESDTTLSVF